MAGSDGGDGLGDLFAQMSLLQRGLAAAQASIGGEVVEGSAGGGAVVVRASGELSFDSVRIDPAAVALGDVQVLEDLVLAAVRDAAAKLADLRRETMGAAVSGALGGLLASQASDNDDEPVPEAPGPSGTGS